MNKYLRFLLLIGILPIITYGQAVNKGQFYIKPGTVVSVYYPLENKDGGDFKNNGELFLHNNLINNGKVFDFKGNVPQGTVYLVGKKLQSIQGNSLINLNSLVLDNPTKSKAFDIKAPLSIRGDVDFKDGIVKVDSIQGAFTFLNHAKVRNVGDHSHIEGSVEKEGNEQFTYPKGDKGYYREATISAPKSDKAIYLGRYSLDDHQFFKIRKNVAGVIDKLNTREYWVIEHSKSTTSDVILTLSWNEHTTPKEIYADAEKNLHILRWDAKAQLWVDEGGIVDVNNKTVSTPASLEQYGFFTLGTVKTEKLLKGDVVIYNLVSANGDGKNDFFRIDNINDFPNNKVEIFNRWGAKVYDTSNYNSNGNVFMGYSEGRGTINKKEQLPTGTYYYIVNYEYKDESGSRMIKKTGYLHLETN